MNFSKNFVFFAAIFLVALPRQSDAAISNLFSSLGIAIEDGITAFKDTIQQEFDEAKQHSHYNAMKQFLAQQIAQGANNEVVKFVMQKLNEGIDHVKVAADIAYEVLKDINEVSRKLSPEGRMQLIRQSFDKSYKDIVEGALAAYIITGGLSELMGPKAVFKRASELTAIGTSDVLIGYEMAKDIVVQGLASGDDTTEEAIMAAYKSIEATEDVLYNVIEKIVKIVAEDFARVQPPEVENPHERLRKTQAAIKNKRCQDAIKAIQQLAMKAFSQAKSDRKQKAIKVVSEGFMDAMMTIAAAGDLVYKAIEDVKSMVDKEAALVLLTKSIAACNNDIINAISSAQQALGALYVILGPQMEVAIIPPMKIVEKAKEAMIKIVSDALVISTQGIKNDTPLNALAATRSVIRTAGTAGYSQLIKSAETVFKAIISALI